MVSFLEKKAHGYSLPGVPCLCESTAPIPQSEASTSIMNGRLGSRCLVAVVNLVLSVSNAVCAESVSCTFLGLPIRREVSGAAVML